MNALDAPEEKKQVLKIPSGAFGGSSSEEYASDDEHFMSTPVEGESVIFEGFGDSAQTEDCTSFETECFLKTKAETFKRHWIKLEGNELYFYRRQTDEKHKVMHCLSGTYLKDTSEKEVADTKGNRYYGLKMVIPPNKSRLIFFTSKEQQKDWQDRLMEGMGYQNVFSYYDML